MSFLPVSSPSVVFLRWILCLTAALMPLVFAPWTSSLLEPNKQLILAVAAALALVGWLWDFMSNGRIRIRHTPLDWGILAFVLGTAIAALAGRSFDRSIFGLEISNSASLVSMLALSILAFISVQTFQDRGKALRTAFMLSAAVTLLVGLLQLLGIYVVPAGFAHSRVFNTVGSPAALGAFAAVVLPLFLSVRLAPQKYPWLNASYLGCLAGVGILLILNTWPLWIVVLAGILALIAVRGFTPSVPRQARIRHLVLPSVIIVIGAAAVITGTSIPGVKSHLPIEIAPSYRLSFNIAGKVLKERTLVGYGPEQFGLAFDRYGASRLADTNLSDAAFFESSSEAATLTAEQGILGLTALGILIVSAGYAAVRLMRDSTVSVEERAVLAALAAACGALFLSPFNTVLMLSLFVFLALAGISLANEKSEVVLESGPAASLAGSLGFVVGLLIAIVSCYGIGVHYAADMAYAKGLKAPDPTAAVALFTTAVNRDASNERIVIALSQAIIHFVEGDIAASSAQPDSSRAARVQNNIANAVSIARRATELSPRDAAAWLNLGTVYQSLVGLVDTSDLFAEQSFEKAAELRPGDPGLPNRIGLMYIVKSDFSRRLARSAGSDAAKFRADADAGLVKAEMAFKRSIELAPNFGQAIYNLGSVYERQGKIAESIREIERIIPANANNPGLLFELGLLYYRAGRKDNALAALQRAVALEPHYANARWYLALFYEERRDLANAIAQVEKVFEANPDNQTVIQKLAALKAGKTEFPPGKVTDRKPL